MRIQIVNYFLHTKENKNWEKLIHNAKTEKSKLEIFQLDNWSGAKRSESNFYKLWWEQIDVTDKGNWFIFSTWHNMFLKANDKLCIDECITLHIYKSIYIHLYIYIHIYIYVYIYLCIYIQENCVSEQAMRNYKYINNENIWKNNEN